MARKIFPDTIAPGTEQKAFELLERESVSPTKTEVLILWEAACAYEKKDPNILTHRFSLDNEFAVKAAALKQQLTGAAY
jgi:hypothetical protein